MFASVRACDAERGDDREARDVIPLGVVVAVPDLLDVLPVGGVLQLQVHVEDPVLVAELLGHPEIDREEVVDPLREGLPNGSGVPNGSNTIFSGLPNGQNTILLQLPNGSPQWVGHNAFVASQWVEHIMFGALQWAEHYIC